MNAQQIMKISGETPSELLERARKNVVATEVDAVLGSNKVAPIYYKKWEAIVRELSPNNLV